MPAALPLLPTAAEACCLTASASASASALTAEKPTPSPAPCDRARQGKGSLGEEFSATESTKSTATFAYEEADGRRRTDFYLFLQSSPNQSIPGLRRVATPLWIEPG